MKPEENLIAELLYKYARDSSSYAGQGSYILIHYDEITGETKSDWLLCETNESINALTDELITILRKMDLPTIQIRSVK